jgi:hypothetical protein
MPRRLALLSFALVVSLGVVAPATAGAEDDPLPGPCLLLPEDQWPAAYPEFNEFSDECVAPLPEPEPEPVVEPAAETEPDPGPGTESTNPSTATDTPDTEDPEPSPSPDTEPPAEDPASSPSRSPETEPPDDEAARPSAAALSSDTGFTTLADETPELFAADDPPIYYDVWQDFGIWSGSGDLTAIIDAPCDTFEGLAWVDSSNYTVDCGATTTITLLESYLTTLTPNYYLYQTTWSDGGSAWLTLRIRPSGTDASYMVSVYSLVTDLDPADGAEHDPDPNDEFTITAHELDANGAEVNTRTFSLHAGELSGWIDVDSALVASVWFEYFAPTGYALDPNLSSYLYLSQPMPIGPDFDTYGFLAFRFVGDAELRGSAMVTVTVQVTDDDPLTGPGHDPDPDLWFASKLLFYRDATTVGEQWEVYILDGNTWVSGEKDLGGGNQSIQFVELIPLPPADYTVTSVTTPGQVTIDDGDVIDFVVYLSYHPTYVTFYGCDGSVLDTVHVVSGTAIPPTTYGEGTEYRFVRWDRSLLNVQADMEVHAVCEERDDSSAWPWWGWGSGSDGASFWWPVIGSALLSAPTNTAVATPSVPAAPTPEAPAAAPAAPNAVAGTANLPAVTPATGGQPSANTGYATPCSESGPELFALVIIGVVVAASLRRQLRRA